MKKNSLFNMHLFTTVDRDKNEETMIGFGVRQEICDRVNAKVSNGLNMWSA